MGRLSFCRTVGVEISRIGAVGMSRIGALSRLRELWPSSVVMDRAVTGRFYKGSPQLPEVRLRIDAEGGRKPVV
ncbi:hypothetical protein SAMN06309944_0784 [Micrococcales bacterium KH10]|nr:hypothetical protein SAMN06309944_0784 [Micrococcales bacterium KH10]